MTLPRYPAYRDSGVEWLGEVPAHWTICHIKRMCAKITDGAHVSPETEEGVFPFISTKDIDQTGIRFENCLFTSSSSFELLAASGCRPLIGDVLFSKDGTIGRTAVVDFDRDFVVASSLIIVRPNACDVSPRFLNFLLNSQSVVGQVENFVKGAGLPRLSIQNLLRIIGVFPSLPEQAAITAFLDRETAKIDGLIAEQERLIELLAEKRRAVVSHAVTKGLDPNAPMKDSGIPWLGEVPAHWEVKRLRRVVQRVEQGWSPECLSRPAEGEEWGVLKTGCVNGGIFLAEENKSLPVDLKPMPIYEVRAGDILMSRASGSPALVGSTGFVFSTPARLMLSDKIYRIELEARHLPRWFVALMSAPIMRNQIVQAISGADGLANNLPQSSLRAFVCAVPSEPEQHAIVAHLDRVTTELDALTTEAQRAVDLLKERRAALISAAVTGKIDVRGVTEEAA